MPASTRYAQALASAIVVSLKDHPPPGLPARVVIRWFDTPTYLTIHALGTEEEGAVPARDAWYPLEWPNSEHELERVDAIVGDESVVAAAEALAAELEEGCFSWEEQPEPLVQAGKHVREQLELAGAALPEHFAVAVCHFEGWGAANSVPRANPPAVVELLHARGLAPEE